MQRTLLALFLFLSLNCFGQIQAGAFLGSTGYIGDLNDKPLKRLKPAVGLSLTYQPFNRFGFRGNVLIGKVEGADKYSGSTFLKQNRNLSFQSRILEVGLVGEFTPFNLDDIRWSPYAFAGVAFFHFNPYVIDSNEKVFLKPLQTEGQGFPENPERKKYSNNQLAIPFGGGLKYRIKEGTTLALELGFRRLRTDYLDDVSGFYTDGELLRQRLGERAYRLSYRGDEVAGSDPAYPDNGYALKNAERGNPKTADWYYYFGLHLSFNLGAGYGKTSASGNKRGYGCPVNAF